MQIKTICGSEYAVISEHQLGMSSGVITITEAIPVKFLNGLAEHNMEFGTEAYRISPTTFLTFKPNDNQVVS
jgi:hypothetical protein